MNDNFNSALVGKALTVVTKDASTNGYRLAFIPIDFASVHSSSPQRIHAKSKSPELSSLLS